MTARELEGLRDEIARIDQQILDLVRERLRTVERIGHLKSDLGLPVRDFRVEAQVVRRLEQRCKSLGIDAGLGRDLATLLINSSIQVQDAIADRSYGGELMRALVLGGRGNMGSWFCRFLRSQGHKVTVVDPAGPLEGFPYATSLKAALPEAELILLATPLGASRSILAEVVDEGPHGLVVDICSLKAPILPEIRRGQAKGLRIASLHPMFSSNVGSLAGKNVVICRCGNPAADALAKELFVGTGANLPEVDVEGHDELVALVLGLGHAVNMAFFTTLVRVGRPAKELEALAGYTFSKQASLARDVARENMRLYYEIQALNPHSPRVLKGLLGATEDLLAMALDGRESDFLRLMEAGRSYFGGEKDG